MTTTYPTHSATASPDGAPDAPGGFAAAPLIAGPALLAVGTYLMITPNAWTVAHLLYLAGAVTMLPVGRTLCELLGRRNGAWLPPVGRWLTAGGALTLSGQFVIDLAVMRLADGDQLAAGPMFVRIQGSAALSTVFYTVGPALLFIGLAAIGVAMINRSGSSRLVKPGTLLVAGSLLMGVARAVGERAAEIGALALILAALLWVVWPATPLAIRRR